VLYGEKKAYCYILSEKIAEESCGQRVLQTLCIDTYLQFHMPVKVLLTVSINQVYSPFDLFIRINLQEGFIQDARLRVDYSIGSH